MAKKYNDILLPDFPEYDASVYPYAYISDFTAVGWNDPYYLIVSDVQAVSTSGGVRVSNGTYKSYTCGTSSESWTVMESNGKGTNYFAGVNDIELVWANTDVYNESNVLYFSASEPVEVVTWLCNGTEVAPFPDTLTFKVLADLNGEIALIASASPAEYVLNDSSGDTLVFNGAVACEAYMYDVENVAWVSEGSASIESLPCGNITWANYILNRKTSADSTETEEIPRDTMIDGVEYDGKDYFETPDTGGDSGGGTEPDEPDNPGGGDTPDNPTEVPNTNSAFMMGYMVGKALRLSR